jgi:hypothetical protein
MGCKHTLCQNFASAKSSSPLDFVKKNIMCLNVCLFSICHVFLCPLWNCVSLGYDKLFFHERYGFYSFCLYDCVQPVDEPKLVAVILLRLPNDMFAYSTRRAEPH